MPAIDKSKEYNTKTYSPERVTLGCGHLTRILSNSTYFASFERRRYGDIARINIEKIET